MTEMRTAIEQQRSSGTGSLTHFIVGLAAGVELGAGHAERASTLLDEAFEILEAGEDRFFEAELNRLRGHLLALGDPAAARRCFREAVKIAGHQGARHFQERADQDLAGVSNPPDR